MKAPMIAAMLALTTGQAHALSCMRPDPIETFQRVAAAEESYFVLSGTLTFDETLLPPGVSQNPIGTPAVIPAQFSGKGLTSDGFVNDYISPINLQITCAGPWCGSAQSGMEAVFFVEATRPLATVIADPCGGMIFSRVSAATKDMLTSCMAGGTCTPLPQTR